MKMYYRFHKQLLVSLLFLPGFFIATNVKAQDRLIFTVDLIRHGDRTPLINIPKAPHDWHEGFGQLTAQGMQQEFELGTHLRKIYIEKYHLLPSKYVVGTVYVRSSDVDRTLMSAQSLLIGLYPLGTGPTLPNLTKPALPNLFQPIPIHTVPKNQDHILIAWTESPMFGNYLKKYIYNTPEWKQKRAETKPKFARWSELTGIKITKLNQLKSIGDTLYIDQRYKVPLPEKLTPGDAQEIINTGRWVLLAAFRSPNIGKITGNELLKAISNYLQEASSRKSLLKSVLLFSHDTTQLSLLSAMEAPLQEVPPYASDLNFSLFEDEKENYYVTVTFNGKGVAIPGCNRSNTCSLSKFKALGKS